VFIAPRGFQIRRFPCERAHHQQGKSGGSEPDQLLADSVCIKMPRPKFFSPVTKSAIRSTSWPQEADRMVTSAKICRRKCDSNESPAGVRLSIRRSMVVPERAAPSTKKGVCQGQTSRPRPCVNSLLRQAGEVDWKRAEVQYPRPHPKRRRPAVSDRVTTQHVAD